jgi:hypothetical protein
LSQANATEKALSDSYEEDFGVTGDTRRKAVTFFLQAARFAGVGLSPHFPTTRLGSGRPPGVRSRPAAQRRAPSAASGTPKSPLSSSSGGDSYRITLQGGGTVTLIVAESHFSLSKNRDDRSFVNSLVDAMTDYASSHGQDVAGPEPEPAPADSVPDP